MCFLQSYEGKKGFDKDFHVGVAAAPAGTGDDAAAGRGDAARIAGEALTYPADLLLLKLCAGGPRDLMDAAQLLKLQSPAERARWKAAAAQVRLTVEYNHCLKLSEPSEN